MSTNPAATTGARRHVLFNPGPVNLDPRVKSAAFAVELCHRQPEFEELHARVREKLYAAGSLSPSGHNLSLLHGSGTLAVDAALASVVRGRVLVVDNGIYCRRLSATLDAIPEADVERLELGVGRAVDLGELAERLEGTRPDWVAVVHHETTTGLLNPLSAIADLCVRLKCRLFVDSVSAFGVHAADSRADVLCFNSGKCLESLPGIAGVFWNVDLVSRAAVPVLDIGGYAEGTPSTPHVQAMLALDAALEILGGEDRPARYERLCRHVWQAGSGAFEPLLPEPDRSHVLTSFRLDGRDYEQLRRRAAGRGYVIYAGQETLYEQIFRIANMGAAIDEDVIDDLFRTLAG